MSDLQEQYKKEITAKLQKDLGIKNPMALPKLTKIVVNSGVKDAVSDKKNIELMNVAISQINAQKTKIAKAKQSIASFKVREGDAIGVVVTLRGKRMYTFFDKVIKIMLPRIK